MMIELRKNVFEIELATKTEQKPETTNCKQLITKKEKLSAR